MNRERSLHVVSIEMEPYGTGWGTDSDDHLKMLQQDLESRIPHYMPVTTRMWDHAITAAAQVIADKPAERGASIQTLVEMVATLCGLNESHHLYIADQIASTYVALTPRPYDTKENE